MHKFDLPICPNVLPRRFCPKESKSAILSKTEKIMSSILRSHRCSSWLAAVRVAVAWERSREKAAVAAAAAIVAAMKFSISSMTSY